MKVTGKGEYADIISRYFQRSFPKIAAVKGKDLLEILTQVLVGSKDLRYGSMPSPESLVTIRKTISRAIELNLPIPILVPWGGRKMDSSIKLDVAEASALRQLIRVDECIRDFYTPGLKINIRIEDLNAEWLYKSDEGIEEYSMGMINLIEILKGDTRITGMRESRMMDKDAYFLASRHYAPLLEAVITKQIAYPDINPEEIPQYRQLVDYGWKGTIPEEQRTYYMDRYKRMAPDLGEHDAVQKLADYFAGSKARYDLKGRGNPDTEVGSFIQINFAHPVPGAPEGIFNNTLYYRTVPASAGRTHIAPWRAKGYLEMIEELVTPKIVHPGSKVFNLEKSYVILQSEDKEVSVVVATDYTYNVNVMQYMPMMMI